jgi:hypothetical protein
MNGGGLVPNGAPAPLGTSASLCARRDHSPTRRDLPIPASPPTNTVGERAARARP